MFNRENGLDRFLKILCVGGGGGIKTKEDLRIKILKARVKFSIPSLPGPVVRRENNTNF